MIRLTKTKGRWHSVQPNFLFPQSFFPSPNSTPRFTLILVFHLRPLRCSGEHQRPIRSPDSYFAAPGSEAGGPLHWCAAVYLQAPVASHPLKSPQMFLEGEGL